MNRLLAPSAIAALLTALPASAAIENLTVDPRHTFPAFEVMHLGMSLQRGRFNKASGQVQIDTAAKAGRADIVIETASVSTGDDKLEQHLKGEDFFNAAKYPQITFKSTDFRFEGDKPKSIVGQLSMNGVTQPVTLNVEHFNCGPHPMTKKRYCGAELAATVKRSDFNIKYGIPMVADEVRLRINVEANGD